MEPLGLYVHIPFCTAICNYCNFNRSLFDAAQKTRYVEALVYQAVAENMASEQSARMVAMKAASDNAGSVIGELQLVYNKTRQAAITKEISEIVGGAAAV